MSDGNAPKPRRDRSGSRSFPLVISVFALLLVAGLALGVVIHGRYVAFERTVARHVPEDAAFVIRWDVEKITLFEPTRRYLLPLLDAAPAADRTPAGNDARAPVGNDSRAPVGNDSRAPVGNDARAPVGNDSRAPVGNDSRAPVGNDARAPVGNDSRAPVGATRRKRLAEASGLDVGRDLREAMAVIGPSKGDWALVLGGAFPETGVAPALERVLGEEGLLVRKLGTEELEGPNGISFGRASDGTLVLASSPARLRAALPVRGLVEAVPRTGAGALFLRADSPGLSDDVRGVLAELGDVSRIEALASWGSPFAVDVTVHYRSRPPPDALDRARRVIAELMGPGAVPPTEVVSNASPANPRLSVRVRLSDEALERVARRAGDSVYGTLWRDGRKSATP